MKCQVLLFSVCVVVTHFLVCVQAKPKPRIAGGTDAIDGEITYQISLETEMDNICGGGIIADEYVITAAHCVIDSWGKFKVAPLTVLAGVLKARTKDDPIAIRVKVKKIYVLSEFRPMNPHPDERYRTTADIAVLKLEHGLGLETNPLLSALKLPESWGQYVNETTVIAGFGDNWIYIYENEEAGTKVEFGGGSDDHLRYALASVLDNDECKEHFDAPIHSTHLCAAVVQHDVNVGEGVCSGDSGSPLVHGGTTVIGIVSSSPLGCTEAESPAVYTRVSSYVSFVRGVLNDGIGSNVRVAILNDYLSPANTTIQIYDEVTGNEKFGLRNHIRNTESYVP